MGSTLHFVIDGKFLTNFVREKFHFENNPSHAMDVLKTVKGITLDDAYKILDGDARFETTEDNRGLYLIEEEDKEFKLKLRNHKKWLKDTQKREELEDKIEDLRVENYVNDPIGKLGIEAKMLCESCRNEKTNEKCSWFATCHEFERRSVEAYPVKEAYCEFGKDEWIIEFCNIPIPKPLIDRYTSNILERIKNLNRTCPIGEGNHFWYDIEGKERMRSLLHAEILRAAGFEVMDMGYASHAFRAVVENYIEKRVRLLGGY